ncbi:MAG: hypothetical protein Q8929_07190, partial [Bacillota bacterium]|nr:hypothetical protein [Bacillota bacterium]
NRNVIVISPLFLILKLLSIVTKQWVSGTIPIIADNLIIKHRTNVRNLYFVSVLYLFWRSWGS